MENNWKTIWSNRTFDYEVLKQNDVYQTFLALKRSDGFDIGGGKLTLEAMVRQYNDIKAMLSARAEGGALKSVYEVGCGCGANLFLFENEGIECGGIDYSKALIDIAKNVLRSDDIICDEAINTPVDKSYDAILSNSVISYFESTDYALEVLEKMYAKAKYSIGIIDIYDIEKKEAFTAYRKATVENYEENYKGLPKLFYSKELFVDFADKHNMDIDITGSTVEGYWNNDFIFNCFLYKK